MQHRATEVIKELAPLSCKERLRGMRQSGEEEAQVHLNNVYKYLMGRNEDGARLISVVSIARSEGSGHILRHRRLCLNNRKHISTLKVAEHWRSLPEKLWSLIPWRHPKPSQT